MGRTAEATSYPTLTHSEKTDVAIVGAGIVGLTAAYSLIRTGLSVTVLEALKIGGQVTGRSTAKVTAQHTLIYRYLIDKFGVDHAQLYADANRSPRTLNRKLTPHNMINRNACFAYFNKSWGHPPLHL